ncbi:hypothetical protein ABD87_15100 [Lysinibacillus sphaericus]|uniref:hypothetical protein n=1 Tax=Lysinibacillus sphaericus TaxID=1421 RepID=UPI0018CE0075|nr:hypothetical protein [Lysinibacillus sphaericus]MBG9730816.1 hypothetical protein [Lysinibacillus sphaericus]
MNNRIVERIKEEGLLIEKDHGTQNVFTYHSGRDLITYPALVDINEPKVIFSLAHELGHHYQRQCYFPKMLDTISRHARSNSIGGLILFPFLFWEEIDAWIRAWHLCKDAKVSLKGFMKQASTGLLSYVSSFLSRVIVTFVTLYIMTVLIVNDVEFEVDKNDFIDVSILVFISLLTLSLFSFTIKGGFNRR